jgi:hypothetical protein
MRYAVVLGLVAVALGCHQAKYNLKQPVVEEYTLPPDDPRYNNPAEYPERREGPRKPPGQAPGGGPGLRGPGGIGGAGPGGPGGNF